MEQWTLVAIAAALALVVGIWKSLDFLSDKITKAMKVAIKEEIQPLDHKINSLESKIDSLSNKVDEVDMNSTKDFLVARLGEVERGGYLDEITRQRFYEELGHYEKLGGDGYIHTWYEELKKRDERAI